MHVATHDDGGLGRVPTARRRTRITPDLDHAPSPLDEAPTIEVAACGHVIGATASAARLIGRTPGDCVGTRLSELVGEGATEVLRSDRPVELAPTATDGSALRLWATSLAHGAGAHRLVRVERLAGGDERPPEAARCDHSPREATEALGAGHDAGPGDAAAPRPRARNGTPRATARTDAWSDVARDAERRPPGAAADRDDPPEPHDDVGRMSLIDDLSHNLGTPLAVVAGYAETLGERWGDLSPTELATATDAIRRHAQRAVEELRGIQARVRAIGTGSGVVPTNLLLAWLRRMLATPLSTTGSSLVEGHVPPQVAVDPSLARQALLTTCQALLGADHPAVRIQIDATTTREGTTFLVTGVDVGDLREDHLAMLEVTAAVVAEAGGGLEQLEGGTRHVVRLPASSRTGATTRRIPVAVVEEDSDTAALIRASLDSLANVFDVVVDARSLDEGMAAVSRTRPRLLVLDRLVPGAAASDVVARVRAASPGTTVVVLSTHPPSEPPAARDGDVRWLEKGRVLADLGPELLAVLASD